MDVCKKTRVNLAYNKTYKSVLMTLWFINICWFVVKQNLYKFMDMWLVYMSSSASDEPATI